MARLISLLKNKRALTLMLDAGFFRSLDRALLFEEKLAAPLCVLQLQCPDNVLRRRQRSRANEEGRTEDNHSSINKRIAVLHHENTTQVLQYYTNTRTLVAVDASGCRADVLTNIELGLSGYISLIPSGSIRERSERSKTLNRKPNKTTSDPDGEDKTVI